MSVLVIDGAKFEGVDFGTAPANGYIIGMTPVSPLLRVNANEYRADLDGVKYFQHTAGDPRGENRAPDDLVRMTMLVGKGRWRQRVHSPKTSESVTVILQDHGDFIAWTPGLAHSWHPELDSTMLTVN